MEKQRFVSKVEYTRNKHSRAVCRGKTIVIRLAKNLSREQQKQHIESLLARMRDVLEKEQKKTLVSPFRHLLEGGVSQKVCLQNGHTYRFMLVPGARAQAKRIVDGFKITVGPRTRRSELHRLLWSCIAKAEERGIATLVRWINAHSYDERITSIRCSFARTQWGSCSRKRVIMINAALLFMPAELLQYVIVHELAHCRVHNHSERYWQTVQAALPNYEEAYRSLQKFRLPQL